MGLPVSTVPQSPLVLSTSCSSAKLNTLNASVKVLDELLHYNHQYRKEQTALEITGLEGGKVTLWPILPISNELGQALQEFESALQNSHFHTDVQAEWYSSFLINQSSLLEYQHWQNAWDPRANNEYEVYMHEYTNNLTRDLSEGKIPGVDLVVSLDNTSELKVPEGTTIGKLVLDNWSSAGKSNDPYLLKTAGPLSLPPLSDFRGQSDKAQEAGRCMSSVQM
ncbi:hypothetical protein TREMEDRAFT_64490 [Tremella mesenterica DSM 1558]|uniref:uncharacterized protein n=1 Tax=Tremella mesenterica (strain ATCC 24925 / CBS 8224 / DSM 1558 / NBRC 9311 / NRRL Y-6157 / RJB 2259-6 / UBC 559-6) TaxID=578456 RepID=UPI0003F4981D|nr:uncharacterized protein TREMEDRAFT_64490 [Tremella mesenterica DSM 1558]EIW67242.1 hypothetical protein TREMEDRAFT_64490 [Tremella mesenterica DSM 1558]